MDALLRDLKSKTQDHIRKRKKSPSEKQEVLEQEQSGQHDARVKVIQTLARAFQIGNVVMLKPKACFLP